MKTLHIFPILLCITGTVLAQEPSPNAGTPPLPSGPLINRAPEFAQWSVTTTVGRAKAKAGENQQTSQSDSQTVVVKTKTIYHIQSVNGAGAKTEKWCDGSFQVNFEPDSQLPIIATPMLNSGGYYTDFSKSDFSGFGWISAGNYTGVDKVGGIDCYIFRGKSKLPHEDGMFNAVASIDVKTRLPISLQVGESVTTYQYGQAPTAMLVLPANVQELAAKYAKRMQQASMMPPP